MFCPNCGHKLPDNATFCSECGSRMEVGAGPQPTPVTTPAADEGTPDLGRTVQVRRPQPAPGTGASAPLPYAPAPSRARTSRTRPWHIVAAVAGGVLVGFVALALVGHFAFGLFTSEEEPVDQEVTIEVEDRDEAKKPAEPAEKKAEKPEATTNAEKKTEVKKAEKNSDFILPESSTRLYSPSDLQGLSDWDLYVARNEIYARHGRGFRNEDLRRHFGSLPWYQETIPPSDFSDDMLNPVERENALMIRGVEEARGSRYLQ